MDYTINESNRVTYDKSQPVSVNVFDWDLQDEWKQKTRGTPPLLIFGIELTMRRVEEFRGSKPMKIMTPYISSGPTLQSIWKNDKITLEAIYKSEKIGGIGDTAGTAMWIILEIWIRT